MGFFSLSATCAVCGNEVGLNRFKITGSGNNILWACPSCARSMNGRRYYIEGDRVIFPSDKETEVKIKCNTCGHLYCFCESDIVRNNQLMKNAQTAAAMSALGALAGTRLDVYANSNRVDSAVSQMIDFAKCPKCNSRDISVLTDSQYEAEKCKEIGTGNVVSQADEITKFKNLLDSGVITQEEFEAKKKQLLGL